MESSAQVPKPAPPIPAISSQYPETGQTLDPESGPPSVMLRDGGGIHSTADWSEPRDVDHGQELRLKWWSRIMDWRLVARLACHAQQSSREPLLNEGEIELLRGDLASFLTKQKCSCKTDIACGQPIALDLLKGVLEPWADIDIDLCEQLSIGVRAGVLEPIEASGVWRKVDVPSRAFLLSFSDASFSSSLGSQPPLSGFGGEGERDLSGMGGCSGEGSGMAAGVVSGCGGVVGELCNEKAGCIACGVSCQGSGGVVVCGVGWRGERGGDEVGVGVSV